MTTGVVSVTPVGGPSEHYDGMFPPPDLDSAYSAFTLRLHDGGEVEVTRTQAENTWYFFRTLPIRIALTEQAVRHGNMFGRVSQFDKVARNNQDTLYDAAVSLTNSY